MNVSAKDLLGAAAVVIALVAYIPYVRGLLSGQVKPHVFSWLLWGLLAGIAFFGQLAGGAGPGAWVTGATALLSFLIFAYALVDGSRDLVPADWLSLLGAGVALVLWFATDDPLLSVVIATVINALAFVPTVRKSIARPWEENASMYFLSGLKFVPALLSLGSVSLLTALFPASLLLMNWLFVALLLVRRRRIGEASPVAVPGGAAAG